MNMLGTAKVKKVFDDVARIMVEILTAFMGDVMYGKATGSSGQQPASAPQGTEEQRHMLVGWFSVIFSGLSLKDEAAFLEALTCLTPAEWSVVGNRLKVLGDPNKADTPEARAFRQAVILIDDFETRVAVLRKAASLPEEDWLLIANASGAAAAGQLNRAWRLVRDHYGPKLLEKAKAADEKIAVAVQGWNANPNQLTERIKQRRSQLQKALEIRKAKIEPSWRRVGEFFGILRPLSLNFETASDSGTASKQPASNGSGSHGKAAGGFWHWVGGLFRISRPLPLNLETATPKASVPSVQQSVSNKNGPIVGDDSPVIFDDSVPTVQQSVNNLNVSSWDDKEE